MVGAKMSAAASHTSNARTFFDKLTEIGKRKRRESYSIYIKKIMKEQSPHMHITKATMVALTDFVGDCFERIATEASQISKRNKRSTLLIEDIEGAVRIVLPPELSRFAMAEGKKSIALYTTASSSM